MYFNHTALLSGQCRVGGSTLFPPQSLAPHVRLLPMSVHGRGTELADNSHQELVGVGVRHLWLRCTVRKIPKGESAAWLSGPLTPG